MHAPREGTAFALLRAEGTVRTMKMHGRFSEKAKRRIIRFAIACAWADLELDESELAVIFDLAEELRLDAIGRALLVEWIAMPPAPEDVDPTTLDPEEARLCLVIAKRVIEADGKKTEEECALYALLRELFRSAIAAPRAARGRSHTIVTAASRAA
jgi:tellurite resistance protein